MPGAYLDSLLALGYGQDALCKRAPRDGFTACWREQTGSTHLSLCIWFQCCVQYFCKLNLTLSQLQTELMHNGGGGAPDKLVLIRHKMQLPGFSLQGKRELMTIILRQKMAKWHLKYRRHF